MPDLKTAKDAARELGVPRMERTLERRGREGHKNGEPGIQYVGRHYLAELAWWQERTTLRRPGRKRSGALER